MLRYIALILLSTSVEANPVSGINDSDSKIIVEENAVYLFDSSLDAENYDSTNCYNVFVNKKKLKKLKKILKEGKRPLFTTMVVKEFFDRTQYSEPYTHVHYYYKNQPVSYFCERNDLVVIKSVKVKKDNQNPDL
jgi:hypothetical protein